MLIQKIDDDMPSLDILGWKIETPAPTNTYLATCLDVDTRESHPFKKFQSEQYENKPAVRLLFAVKDADQCYLVQSRVLKASGSPKSNFYKMIRGWIGEFPDTFDVQTLVGKHASLQVEQRTTERGTVYSGIMNISAVPEQFKSACPDKAEFRKLMEQAGVEIGEAPQPSKDPLLPKETPPPANPQPMPDASEEVPF